MLWKRGCQAGIVLLSLSLAAGAALAADAPRTVALQYAASNTDRLGLVAGDVADIAVASEVYTQHNRVTNLYLNQRFGGIEVQNAILNVAVDAQGKVFYTANRFVPHLAEKGAGQSATLTVEQAISAAAHDLQLSATEAPRAIERRGGVDQASTWTGAGLSVKDIPARLKYLPINDGATVRLAWELVLQPPGGKHWWHLFVDASTGAILARFDWIASDSYNVFPIPAESPAQTAQTVLTNPADPVASAFAWHDTNGAAGAEFTDTRGNNVSVQDDLDDNDTGGSRPSGGGSLVFNVAWNSALDPDGGNNLNVALINLFYMNNFMHDWTYHYGFDEAGGNFQQNNYGHGGVGSDSVQADGQDGSGVNNANFGTPPDGSQPRMQMFVWQAPPNLLVNTPAGIAGDKVVAGASFGAQPTLAGMTNDFVYVNDGIAGAGGGTVNDGCEVPFVNAAALAGKFALVDRGLCEFGVKGLNSQNQGAVAMVVVNNVAGAPVPMGPGAVGASVTIPSMMIGQTDGNAIKANLPVNAKIYRTLANRDSDLDNGIIAHEYTHGISNRLTGGPANVSCLQNAEQMGEGWSDFSALVSTAKASDTATTLRPMSSYVAFSNAGIRQFPYTTDMTVNTHTYANVATVAIPHGVGSVWAEMLWEMYWKLVTRYGFDADLFHGTGGNNIAYQLVIDGMKLQPCSPGFVDGRNAILAADLANNCGRNRCLIWEAFAKRGLGLSASQGSPFVATDGTQAFDLPVECGTDWLFTDDFEAGSTCGWTTTIN